MKKLLILLVVILLSAACTKQEKNTENEVAYRYLGEFVSLVDQRKEPFGKEMKINYTLQLKNFSPKETVFSVYHNQFQHGSEEAYKHVEITKRTKVYELDDNERKEVPIINIENSNRLEVWIKPHHLSDYHIEVLEIYIIE
ncbi:hypothetical protein ACFP56_10890 [Paenibacillus septentrionalis]|uniref:DUF4352 domain-containing protein n=1 Tax=Paenibacillus septentrionalis TaxID=429342 RepID=A0ABW1V6V2_9BACL